MASDWNTSMDTLSEGSDNEMETVDTSDLEESEDDDYLPVPRDPFLTAKSPIGWGDNINARAGQAPSDSDDSESDFVRFHQQWTSDPEPFNRRVRNVYNSNPGPNTALPNEAKAVDYFKEFWDQALIDKLTAETNRYAQQQRLFQPPPRFAAKWKPVQEEEMMAFLGLCTSTSDWGMLCSACPLQSCQWSINGPPMDTLDIVHMCIYAIWMYILDMYLLSVLGENILTLNTCCCLYWITLLKCPLQDNYRSVTFLTITFLFFKEFSKFFLHDV